jgi:hypothetical protein
MAGPLTKQLNFGVTDETHRIVMEITRKHRTQPTDLCRGLVEAACDFYEQHGFFSFPVRIEPEAFQHGYITKVAEPASPYGERPNAAAEIEADEVVRRDLLAKKKKTRSQRRGGDSDSGATDAR